MSNCLVLYLAVDVPLDEFCSVVHGCPVVVSKGEDSISSSEHGRSVLFGRYGDGSAESPHRDIGSAGFGSAFIFDYGYPDDFIKDVVTCLAKTWPMWVDLDDGPLRSGGQFVFEHLSDPDWNWFSSDD